MRLKSIEFLQMGILGFTHRNNNDVVIVFFHIKRKWVMQWYEMPIYFIEKSLPKFSFGSKKLKWTKRGGLVGLV